MIAVAVPDECQVLFPQQLCNKFFSKLVVLSHDSFIKMLQEKDLNLFVETLPDELKACRHAWVVKLINREKTTPACFFMQALEFTGLAFLLIWSTLNTWIR